MKVGDRVRTQPGWKHMVAEEEGTICTLKPEENNLILVRMDDGSFLSYTGTAPEEVFQVYGTESEGSVGKDGIDNLVGWLFWGTVGCLIVAWHACRRV